MSAEDKERIRKRMERSPGLLHQTTDPSTVESLRTYIEELERATRRNERGSGTVKLRRHVSRLSAGAAESGVFGPTSTLPPIHQSGRRRSV
jgi:hypothetical protein